MGNLERFTPDEIEQSRKKINRLLKNSCDKEVLGAMLGLEFSETPDLNGKPLVEILVPSYKGHDPAMEVAVRDLIKYTKQYCAVDVPPSPTSPVIHWARNEIISPLYKNKSKFTHACFIDDDIIPEKDSLVRMLRHEKDIVGALCAARTDPSMPTLRRFDLSKPEVFNIYQWPEGKLLGDKDDLGIGAGMLLVSKRALDALANFYIACEYEKLLWGVPLHKSLEMSAKRQAYFDKTGNAMWFEFLKAPNGAAEYGEDISLCYKAHLCGFRVYVDTAIQPKHMGKYGYSVSDFAPFQQEMVDVAKNAGWDCTLTEG